jgi:arylsulfatase A-like enzyme
MTIYDIAPTVLDLLGIDYSPKFVIGKSAFEKESSHVLSHEEHEEIYSFFAGLRWEKRFRRRHRRRLFRGLYKVNNVPEGLPDTSRDEW